KQRVRRYLNKGDAKSTSNMAKHAKNCWGEAAYQAAQVSGTADSACKNVVQSILHVRQIAQMLQTYDGDINFATDTWTSPNHSVC
ncbi:hypothetical protein P692DRAFT_20735888, partial [Suillus brevipes Sb2]